MACSHHCFRRSVDQHWFDPSCQRSNRVKLTANRVWCRTRYAVHWGRFLLACAEDQRVYAAARESHYVHTRNLLRHSTCSHK